jgi:enoyl-CoA hydratase
VTNDDVSAVIITGDERAFAAGADIAEMRQLDTRGALALSDLGHRVMTAIETLDKPVFAVVRGYALGGGLELALACDFIYCATDAKLGQPEVGLGIIPGFGGTQRLARAVGQGAAKELIYSGEIIDAEKAKQIGLVRDVYEPDELMKKVMERIDAIISKGCIAVGTAKRVMNKGIDLSMDAALELEKQAFSALFGTADQKEGMSAFLEKRAPYFTQR